jgi:heterodisulfide reductase subunit C
MSDISYYELITEDVRIKEGLNACMGCGICTAVCPAASFFEYDPRSIATTVQSGNEDSIRSLLESDTIWYCGQCMSCKTRCPRNNCPGMIISVLRRISQESGLFMKSKFGRQQILISRTVGRNILRRGYCVHPASVYPDTHPEQGPVWQWIYQNMETVYDTVGANLDGEGAGAMRKIQEGDLNELNQIFKVTGGIAMMERIEACSREKALELEMTNDNGDPDMEAYCTYIMRGSDSDEG